MARRRGSFKRKKIPVVSPIVETFKKEIPVIIETKVAKPRFICPRCESGMTIIKEVSNETVLTCPKCHYNMTIC